MSSPDLIHRQEWSPSIPSTGRQCSPSKWSCPQDACHRRLCISWGKDGNPYLLGGIARGKSLFVSEVTTVEQFLSLLLLAESVCPYLPWARTFRPWESNDVCPGRPRTAAEILIRQTSTAVQTAPIWMWHVATQTSQMTTPTPVCLVGEWYTPENLSFGPINWRCLQLPLVPEICLLVLSHVGLPASGELTVVMPLYHMLLEVS